MSSLHPFVKWAGGKTQLLDKIHELMPAQYNRYYEPFVGGGALLFSLVPKDFIINDFNSELISAYKCFMDTASFDKLIGLLCQHEANHSEEYYYKVRAMDREPNFRQRPIWEHAARMIYLNKACFNGLYRVNSHGFFNVPFGKKEKVHCFENNNLRRVKDFFASAHAVILNGDFQEAVKDVGPGDFVYFDPPYDVWKEKLSFTSYVQGAFGKPEQRRLADVYKNLSDKGAYVRLSNHNTDYIRELYHNFSIHVVPARRVINSNPAGRGQVEEVIITNY